MATLKLTEDSIKLSITMEIGRNESEEIVFELINSGLSNAHDYDPHLCIFTTYIQRRDLEEVLSDVDGYEFLLRRLQKEVIQNDFLIRVVVDHGESVARIG